MSQSKCPGCGELSEKEMFKLIDGVIAQFKNTEGALIPVLQTVQNALGHLPPNALQHISNTMDIPYSQVSGVVSFYSFFSTKPRGKHVIRVCLGTACYVRGGLQVLEALKKELSVEIGDTTADKQFTLEVARCFGACGLAPAMSIDEEVFKRVRPVKVPELLRDFLKRSGKGAKK